MARLFDDASLEYLYHNSAIVSNEPFSFACGFKSDQASIYQVMMCITKLLDTNMYTALGLYQGKVYATSRDSTGNIQHAFTSTSYAVNTWNFACSVHEADNSRAAFLNGGGKGTNENSVSVTGQDTTYIGRMTAPSTYFMSGHICCPVFFNYALTEDKVLSLAKAFSPELVSPQGIAEYWDLIRGLNGKKGRVLTASGTVVSDNPRIIQPYSPRFISIPSVIGDLSINVNDAVNISENIDIGLSSPVISVYDALNVSEDVSVVIIEAFSINVNDSINLTENISLVMSDMDIDVNDALNVAENIDIILSDLILSVFDALNVTENVSVVIGNLVIEVDETVNLSENISVNLIISLSVNDTINLAESVDIDALIALGVFDTVTLTEFLDLGISVLEVSVIDTTNLTENVGITIAFTLGVYDSINLTEDVSSVISDSEIAVHDSITLGEYNKANCVCLIDANDTINIAENIDLTTIIVQGEVFIAFSATKPDIEFVGV